MNIYDFEPIRVHLNEQVYYFYFKENLDEDDYEPVKEVNDNGKTVIISRYHWHLLTLWTNLAFRDGETNISFGDNWHTPFAQCEKYYPPDILSLEPKGLESKTGKKYALIKLVGLFLPYFYAQIYLKFHDSPIPFDHLVTSDKVPDGKFNFTLDDMVGIVVIGGSREIPPVIEHQLRDKYFLKLKEI